MLAVFCALLSERIYPWHLEEGVTPGAVITLGGFVVAGLFAAQLGHNRRRLERQLQELETQNRLRHEAEEEKLLRSLESEIKSTR